MPRKRWLYTLGGEPLKEPLEISDDTVLAPRRAQVATEGVVYSNLRATDGTPLDSRKKHREYMKRNGLAMADDYKETLPKREADRIKAFLGEKDTQTRREQIGRALHERRRRR